MRKFFSILSVMAIAFATTTAFTSCGSDDDEIIAPVLAAPNNQPTAPASLVGHKLICQMSYFNPNNGQKTETHIIVYCFTTETNYVGEIYLNKVDASNLKDRNTGKYRYDGRAIGLYNEVHDNYSTAFYFENGVWKGYAPYDYITLE